jgi:hypothetical protein
MNDTSYSPIIDKDVFDIENSFYLRSDPYRIGKLLAQFEIYKTILELPGAIVECGVFKGVSLIRFATFRHALETQESRKIIGFDAFGDFPQDGLIRADDVDFAETHDDQSGGPGISVKKLTEFLGAKGFGNFELIQGNVLETISPYFAAHDYEKIALLHLDMDVYAPTKAALELLYDRVISGGIIMIDDYGTVSGATAAVDELAAAKSLEIKKAKYYKIPAYIIKP